MVKTLLSVLLASPAIIASQWLLSGSAIAKEIQAEVDLSSVGQIELEADEALETDQSKLLANSAILDQVESYSLEGQEGIDSIDQLTDVNQLRDVSPGDWAYEALRNLVENYGCIVGYPDLTYRGTRALSRWEFAAGLNACLTYMERLLQENVQLLRDDIDDLKRLMREFEAELAALGARVDNLEGRVAFLEDHQFSTTTKLEGEVVFGLAGTGGGADGPVITAIDADGDEISPGIDASFFFDNPGAALAGNFSSSRFNVADLASAFPSAIGANLSSTDDQFVFQDRVRLNFVSSFTGEDALYTRLDAGNAAFFNNTDQGAFTYSFDNGNDVEIGWLAYYFPIGEKILVYVPAAFPLWQDIIPTVSPVLEGFTGAGASISSFGESSPIYKIGLAEGGGIAFNYELTDKFTFSAGYFGGDSFDPSEGNGLFNGEYSALGQILFEPNDKLQFAFTYVNAYFNETGFTEGANPIFDLGVGTTLARTPFFGDNSSVITNSYGIQGSFRASEKFIINAFGGFTDARQTSGPTIRRNGEDRNAQIWYYALGLGLPDLGKEGNLLGLVAGAEPYVGGVDDTALHFEAFYKYQVNDGIAITPGIIVITAPFGNNNNDTAYIGTLRTTFSF